MLIKQRFCGFHSLLLINLQNSALSLPGAEFFVIEKINRKHPVWCCNNSGHRASQIKRKKLKGMGRQERGKLAVRVAMVKAMLALTFVRCGVYLYIANMLELLWASTDYFCKQEKQVDVAASHERNYLRNSYTGCIASSFS